MGWIWVKKVEETQTRTHTLSCRSILLHLQFHRQFIQQPRDLLQVLDPLLGVLTDSSLVFGQRRQQRQQLLQIPLLLDVLVQRLQLHATGKDIDVNNLASAGRDAPAEGRRGGGGAYAAGRQREVAELCLHLTFGQLFALRQNRSVD